MFADEGYEVIGFDIEDMSKKFEKFGIRKPKGCTLRLHDVLTLSGSELADAAVIVASPPCSEPSYRAMPWKRAKALNAAGPPHKFIAVFEACFRIQREASEAAGRHIPMIVENVVGAQRWIGRARWHFGSFYLWGDVPALMPSTRAIKNNGGSWFNVAHNTESGKGRNPDGRKTQGQNWNRFRETGEVSPHYRLEGHLTNPSEHYYGVKGVTPNGPPLGRNTLGSAYGSKSSKRALASAMIAKIPEPLARHIARTYWPRAEATA